MARLTPLHLIPALIAAASHAGEVTIEPRPFSIEKSFAANALPSGECQLLRLVPKAWTDFKILQLAESGRKAAKGEELIRFDPADFDKKLEDSRRALQAGTLSLAQAELDSKNLAETSPNKLESLRRSAEIAKEENAYFTKIRRKATEETAAQRLKKSEQILSNQREELRQLSKMYAADDITEETEEIILTRQQDAVAAAEFALRMETLDQKHTVEVELPREAKTLADSERDTAIALKKAEIDIPRAVELNKLALEALKTANLRAKQELADLEADRALFEFKAPADGMFYYGAIENGRWTVGDTAKYLVPNGRPPQNAAFATFVPGTSKFGLVSFLDDATARALKPDLAGIALLAGREDLEIPVKLVKLATAPGPDGTYRADFSATWPKEIAPGTAAGIQIRLITYQQPSALVIPTKALDFSPNGWTVEVKLTDGKSERRAVKRGRVSREETEILSGLEPGQVIVVPDKKD
jgi:hypothetical protein